LPTEATLDTLPTEATLDEKDTRSTSTVSSGKEGQFEGKRGDIFLVSLCSTSSLQKTAKIEMQRTAKKMIKILYITTILYYFLLSINYFQYVACSVSIALEG
jgi:hypothetical protein